MYGYAGSTEAGRRDLCVLAAYAEGTGRDMGRLILVETNFSAVDVLLYNQKDADP
jgi:hypothetical protein